jgi:MFS family permease
MQYARSILKSLTSLIGGSDSIEEAWVDTDESLSPREKLVRQIAGIMQWGSIANVLLLLVLNLLLAFNYVEATQMSNWLFSGWLGSVSEMTLLGMVAIGANVAALLLLSAASGAQEFWAWLLLIAVLVLNVMGLFLYQFYPAIVALIPAAIGSFFMVRDWRAFHLNAVSVRELRGRMRGVRSFAIITVFLLLMGSFVVLLYLLQLPRLRTTDVIITGNLGQLLFFGVVGVELMLMDQPELRHEIARLEQRLEELSRSLERSRKAILASKLSIAGGGLLVLSLVSGLVSAVPLAIVVAIAAILGGIVGFGSNVSTARQESLALHSAMAARAELIGRLDLRDIGQESSLSFLQ